MCAMLDGSIRFLAVAWNGTRGISEVSKYRYTRCNFEVVHYILSTSNKERTHYTRLYNYI